MSFDEAVVLADAPDLGDLLFLLPGVAADVAFSGTASLLLVLAVDGLAGDTGFLWTSYLVVGGLAFKVVAGRFTGGAALPRLVKSDARTG